jgi:hypothetical protein
VQKPRRFSQRDVFFPSYLEKREQKQLRETERRGWREGASQSQKAVRTN